MVHHVVAETALAAVRARVGVVALDVAIPAAGDIFVRARRDVIGAAERVVSKRRPRLFLICRWLLRQIFVEERRQLAKVLLCLGCIGIARILRMRLALEHVEICDDTGLTQLAMHAYRVGKEQVTCA